ncbi:MULTISPECIES: hypothetical protein [Cellulophaga]|uniref:WG repeat-containing protein n=1 Tax=Cellulophaga geojensis KL-A TaxID=1328323 RepID=A0ABP3B576_9FLAO|nr:MULTISPECIES: hypothetical protein [Cellulophaga]AIM59810.1 hypothetical protein IX49_04475 [Cellulophaga lytica]APU09675.1 hypothetical protein A5M85_05070 [Cellulophaga lytica]EWH12963.1 hypothetical protein KLA_11530 [Cellulophaga geojensis KL-A]MDO6854871.1 hypothetical protein [Cellulophaga lytica]SNQ42444.1 conserved exported hypothetical protein [Cellulophaga lytica]
MKTFLIFILSISTMGSFAQKKDSLISAFGINLKLYKNRNTNTFEVHKNDEKVIFKNLKIAVRLNGFLQVLDEKNNMFYINEEGSKVEEANLIIEVCGTVPNYTYEIIKRDNTYIVTELVGYDGEENLAAKEIGSISAAGIDKINFSNGTKKVTFDANESMFYATETFLNAVLISKGKKKGVLYNNTVNYYDAVTAANGILKVQTNNKVGYYNITEVKYKDLAPFVNGLAKFTTTNNKTGYIDANGNEYYN